MAKRLRLRLHVETDLLGTRITPSQRLKDPCLAALPRPHRLSARQLELWQQLFPGKPAKSLLLERIHVDTVMERIRIRLPDKGRVRRQTDRGHWAHTLEVTVD